MAGLLSRLLVALAVLAGTGRGKRGGALALLALADAANRLHKIGVVDRLLRVPGDVAIHVRVRAVPLHRCRIPLDVERKHRENRCWNGDWAESNRVPVYSPLVAALADGPVGGVTFLRCRSNRIVVRANRVGDETVDGLLHSLGSAD